MFKLFVLEKYQGLIFEPIREFGKASHPIVLMRHTHKVAPSWGNTPWISLMCPCDLKWKWSFNWRGRPRWFSMIMTGGINDCSHKEEAREVVRTEIREKNKARWATMPLADRAHDLWRQHLVGAYLGEHNVGTLYVQDLERLLGTTPQSIKTNIKKSADTQGEIMSFSYPSKEILSAVHELRKRKLLDLSGMVLVPHKESFRFPDELHHQFAFWIEEPLGYPNGDAGDGFMYRCYKQLADKTGWTSGESVFGEKNLPALSPEWKIALTRWLARLDQRLVDATIVDKSLVLEEISIETWINWLVSIKQEVVGSEE